MRNLLSHKKYAFPLLDDDVTYHRTAPTCVDQQSWLIVGT